MDNEWISRGGWKSPWRLGILVAWTLCPGNLPAATFTVSSTANAGAGSLRQAILSANLSPGPDLIRFQLAGTGVRILSPLTELPALAGPTSVDGTTQPGYAGTPLVEISGLQLPGSSGLRITGGGCTVRGLRLANWDGAGVRVEAGDGNWISGNCFGLDGSGAGAAPNGVGIWIGSNSSSNTIGGSDLSSRNFIAGNRAEGISVAAQAAANVIQGNWVGLDLKGNLLGNGGAGILLSNCPDTTLGGLSAEAGNIICGNIGAGVVVEGLLTSGTVIQGNQIGCRELLHLSNVGPGIWLLDSVGVTVGGVEPAAGNVISGNVGPGLRVEGRGHVVQGNRIGTDATGQTALPNGSSEEPAPGMDVAGSEHTIGGSAAGRNLISGNSGVGLLLRGSNLVVQANWIGTDGSGSGSLGNGADGIRVEQNSRGNTLGGVTSEERNVISGNAGSGIVIDGPGASANVVQGNFLGVAFAGTVAIGNGAWGIQFKNGSSENGLGGPEPGQGNIISGNRAGGVQLTTGAHHTLLQGNQVGLGPDGKLPIPNHGPGIRMESGAHDITIGGEISSAGNQIGFNAGSGVSISGLTSVANRVQGNSIYGNLGLGIDLVAPGEVGDVPTFPEGIAQTAGPNHLVPFPIVTNVTLLAGLTAVQGTVRMGADSSRVVQVYVSAEAHPSGLGEGQVYLGSVEAVAGPNGDAGFALLITDEVVGHQFSATSQDPATGDTSEFGPAFDDRLGAGATRLWIRTVPGQHSVEIHFYGAPGHHYELQSSLGLAPATWTAVKGAEDLPGTGGFLVWSEAVSAEGPGRFYRMRVR